MTTFKEKELIYTLMQEIIQERREFTKQYHALKERLELLDNPYKITPPKKTTQLSLS